MYACFSAACLVYYSLLEKHSHVRVVSCEFVVKVCGTSVLHIHNVLSSGTSSRSTKRNIKSCFWSSQNEHRPVKAVKLNTNKHRLPILKLISCLSI